MHAKEYIDDGITRMHVNSKLKKTINFKLSIQIKFGLHHYLSYDKIFKTNHTCLYLHDI